MPAARGRAKNDVTAARHNKELCHSSTFFWCACRANKRMTRNNVRTVEFKASFQEHLNMPGAITDNIKLTKQENNEIHFQAKQTTQIRKLKETHRLGAVMQVEPEEDGLVQVPVRRTVLIIPMEKQEGDLMLIMPVEPKGDVYGTTPSEGRKRIETTTGRLPPSGAEGNYEKKGPGIPLHSTRVHETTLMDTSVTYNQSVSHETTKPRANQNSAIQKPEQLDWFWTFSCTGASSSQNKIKIFSSGCLCSDDPE